MRTPERESGQIYWGVQAVAGEAGELTSRLL